MNMSACLATNLFSLTTPQLPSRHSGRKSVASKATHKTSHPTRHLSVTASSSRNSTSTDTSTTQESIVDSLKFNSWAPELINGRCAMLGYVAGYGYEALMHESFVSQAQEYWWAFVVVSILVTLGTLKTGKPTKECVMVNGLTPEAELFNGRAAMIGFASTLAFELSTKLMN